MLHSSSTTLMMACEIIYDVVRNGKIGVAQFDIIHVKRQKALQYPLSQVLQMRWPVLLDVVANRHPDTPYKYVSIIFNSHCSAFRLQHLT